ncbi:hypothetical protein H5410_012383 [Solanum commersonii]|uniref:Uncharacterized protein n=1 Tax=Solanum commersonii TaxID=4109 RepID=A0A9J6ARD3_SOLCO|nr:hypothetical protein H5410_012383 [Solanum commersonii]
MPVRKPIWLSAYDRVSGKFLGDLGDTKGKHRMAWIQYAYAEKGGIRLRSLQHVVDASICQTMVEFSDLNVNAGQLHLEQIIGSWASYLEKNDQGGKEEVEHNIPWQGSGIQLRFDNRTKPEPYIILRTLTIPREEVDYKIYVKKSHLVPRRIDKAWWMANSNGKFSPSAWDILRTRKKQVEVRNKYGVRGLSFKINFFFPKASKGRIARDDNPSDNEN